ncbi:hypothetical protein [Blautia fusiformis]|uniref:hypothetical protein n=1 Tax=Blautia fusiformis TaxID=2881264 RepID=UPI001D0E2CF2|nr:hypothetical protein [Blautia fusiformis]MCC2152665.1 hypothetical protein [Blautia fusiformis]
MQKSEVRKWPEMNRQQKIQYLKDYYLFPAAVVVILAAVVISLIWHVARPRSENLLYAAVIDESLDEKKLEQATEDISELLGADGKKKTVQIDDSFYIKDGALDKLQVYLHSQQIDVVILDKEVFEEYAGYGYFESLDEVTAENLEKKYGETYQYAGGYKDDDEVSFEDHETGQGEVKPYGISLSGNNRFTEMSQYIKDPVFAVATGTKNPENALKFLDYLLEK